MIDFLLLFAVVFLIVYPIYMIMLNSFKKEKRDKEIIDRIDKFTKEIYTIRVGLEALNDKEEE